MCRFHWRKLPAELRRRVYATWNRGLPTPAYPRVAEEAIDLLGAKG